MVIVNKLLLPGKSRDIIYVPLDYDNYIHTFDTELRIRGGSTAVESIGLIPAYVVFSFRLRSRLFVVLYLTARWRLVESTTKQTEM